MTGDLVLTEKHGDVRLLRFNRPEARNAMSTALLEQFLEEFMAALGDEGVRGIVLAGSGGSFSAGADLREELDDAGQVRRMDLFTQVYGAVASALKPVVAAIEGHCVGGGIEVAAAADLRVADPTASFRFPGAALGIPVGAAKLVGLVGLGTAKDLVLTSRTFDPEEAVRIGFLQRLTEPGAATAVAVEVATQIGSHNTEVVAYLKRQFARFSGVTDRVAAENDALLALTEAGGDVSALTAPDPKAGWRPGG